MQVLEHEHERPFVGDRLEEATPGGERLLAFVARPGVVRLEPDEWTQLALDPGDVCGVFDEPRHGAAQLFGRLLGAVRVEDSRLRLHHLRQRPERDALAVGQRTPVPPEDEPEVARLDRLEELVDEPALADAGHADQRHELRLPLADHARQRLAQQRQLLLATDQRRAADALDSDAGPGSARLPDRHGLGLALRLHRSCLDEVDRALRCSVGGLVDEDRVRVGRRLQARGRVDDIPGGHALARFGPGTEGDQRLAGGDADADVQLLLAERVADRERGPHRPLGVVLVRDWGAEDRHHRVADELLDRPAEALELRPDRAW